MHNTSLIGFNPRRLKASQMGWAPTQRTSVYAKSSFSSWSGNCYLINSVALNSSVPVCCDVICQFLWKESEGEEDQRCASLTTSWCGLTCRGPRQWRFYVGAREHRPPNLAQPPQIFGHSSSATGWINWFYSKFRLAVVASQMMRGQAPQIFFLELVSVLRAKRDWGLWVALTRIHDMRIYHMMTLSIFPSIRFRVPLSCKGGTETYVRYWLG